MSPISSSCVSLRITKLSNRCCREIYRVDIHGNEIIKIDLKLFMDFNSLPWLVKGSTACSEFISVQENTVGKKPILDLPYFDKTYGHYKRQAGPNWVITIPMSQKYSYVNPLYF